MATVKLNIRGLTVLGKIQRAQDIINAMTGNASFPSPLPTIATLQALVDSATTKVAALDAAQQTVQLKLVDRDQAVSELVAALISLAGYVQSASLGDAMKILSAGMDIKSPPTPLGLPEAPGNLRAEMGAQEGSCLLDWNSVPGARSYLVECAPNATGPWALVATVTDTQAVVGELTSGTKYYFRARALGAAGLGPWSDIAVKMAA